MKIERVDSSTIKCYLSLDELQEYEVDYKDFISRTEKAQVLMKEIIEQAKEQVGYHPPKLAFEMQIMMVPEQGMVLTFSEKEPFDMSDEKKVEGFLNGIKGILERVQSEAKDKEGSSIPPELMAADKMLEALMSGKEDPSALGGGFSPKDAKLPKRPLQRDEELDEAVYVFRSISRVMEFARVLPKGLRMKSRLYKMDNHFFLYLGKGKASFEKFSHVCVQALEFASLYRAGEECELALKERGELLIEEKALRRLAK